MIDFSHFNSIYELTSYFNSEERCRRAIFESRWDKHDVVCPFCGQHHCVSRTDGRFHCSHCKAYLERYIDEAVFRFNTKEMKEAYRFGFMFEKAMGTCYYKDVKTSIAA